MSVDLRILEGGSFRATATLADGNGIPVDPLNVTFRVKDAQAGTVTAYQYGVAPEVTRLAAGSYRLTLDAGPPGRYVVRVETAGGAKSAAERECLVVPSEVV